MEIDIGSGDVLVLQGSPSDDETMNHVHETLKKLSIRHYCAIASVHRTPERVKFFAEGAEAAGYKAVITGAGLAAGLGGGVSAHCWTLPIFGVGVPSSNSRAENATELSMTCLPEGTPVNFCGFGKAGAVNASLSVAAIVGLFDPEVRKCLLAWRKEKSESVPLRPKFITGRAR